MGNVEKITLKNDRWTWSLDARNKRLVDKAAKRRGIDHATILEDLVRDKFNPFGHTDVEGSVSYVADLRKQGRAFLQIRIPPCAYSGTLPRLC